MNEIVERLSSVADLVIVDSTPVLSLSDALELAPAMDGVLLVVDVGKASWGEVEESALQLRSVGAQMLGVVATKVVPGRFRGYHHARYEEYQRLVPAPTPSGPVDSDDGESQREHAGRGDDGDSAGMAAGSR
jgi:Mrp family chromosome partitioning ATPase